MEADNKEEECVARRTRSRQTVPLPKEVVAPKPRRAAKPAGAPRRKKVAVAEAEVVLIMRIPVLSLPQILEVNVVPPPQPAILQQRTPPVAPSNCRPLPFVQAPVPVRDGAPLLRQSVLRGVISRSPVKSARYIAPTAKEILVKHRPGIGAPKKHLGYELNAPQIPFPFHHKPSCPTSPQVREKVYHSQPMCNNVVRPKRYSGVTPQQWILPPPFHKVIKSLSNILSLTTSPTLNCQGVNRQVVVRFMINDDVPLTGSDNCVLIRFALSSAIKPAPEVHPRNLTLIVNRTVLVKPEVFTYGKKAGFSVPVEVPFRLIARYNELSVSWTECFPNQPEDFGVSIVLAKQLSVASIVAELETRTIRQHQSVLLVQQKLSAKKDDDIIVSNKMVVSLNCPLSRKRIELPARGANCLHLECFDANDYITLNKAPKPKWMCPRCNSYVPMDQLFIDEFVQDLLRFTNENTVEIESRGKEIVARDVQKVQKVPVERAPVVHGYHMRDGANNSIIVLD